MLVVCDLVRFNRVLSAAQGTQVQSPPVPGGCWSRDSGESVYAWINCSVDDLTRRAGGQAAPECLGGNTMEAIRDAARITVWRIKKPDEMRPQREFSTNGGASLVAERSARRMHHGVEKASSDR